MNKKLAIQFQKILKVRSFLKKDANKYVGARWITAHDQNVCPVCTFLGELGWLPFDSFPDIGQAHSQLGGPNWKASDAACRCTTDFSRKTFTDAELSLGPNGVEQLWYKKYATLSKEDKEIKMCNCLNKTYVS